LDEERRTVLERLRRIDWGSTGAELVVVHGSVAAGRARPRDVDLIVFAEPGRGDEAALKVMEAVEEAVDLEADVYVVEDPSEANCFLLLEALRRGVIVFQTPRGREKLVRAVNICYDFMLSRRKLNYTDTLVARVLGNAS
jgi:predicted nucleotidyltransferase